MNTKYSFHYSRLVVIISTIGIIALVGLLYQLISSETTSGYEIIGWIAVLVFLYPIVSMPRSLVIDDEKLVLNRLVWSDTYSLSKYSYSEVESLRLDSSYRLFGSGGYFGFTGLFWQSKIGLFKLVQTEESSRYIKVSKRGGEKAILYIAIP